MGISSQLEACGCLDQLAPLRRRLPDRLTDTIKILAIACAATVIAELGDMRLGFYEK
jgi:hypothetical protein